MTEYVRGEDLGDPVSGECQGCRSAGSSRVHDDRLDRRLDQVNRRANGTEVAGVQRHRREDRLAGALEVHARRLGLGVISTGEVDGIEAAGFGELRATSLPMPELAPVIRTEACDDAGMPHYVS